MNKAIRRLWIASACVFVLLLGALTYIQFFESKNLMANQWNSRTLYDSYGSQRGSIVVDGTEIASSVPSNDGYDYQRVYSQPELYAGLTGYFSSIYGSSGLESAMNDELSGNGDEQFYDRIAQMFSGGKATGATVELTIDPVVQQRAAELLDGHKGAIVAMNPKTGEILAMASSPSYDPNELSSHDNGAVIDAYSRLNSDTDNPLYNRAIAGNTYSPGSTFKIFTYTAAIEQGKLDPSIHTIADAHAQFLGRYRQLTGGQWNRLPNDGYIHQHLTWHFVQAGIGDEIHELMAVSIK